MPRIFTAEQKAANNARSKLFRIKNKEKIAVNAKAYRESHVEEIREKKKKRDRSVQKQIDKKNLIKRKRDREDLDKNYLTQLLNLPKGVKPTPELLAIQKIKTLIHRAIKEQAHGYDHRTTR
jgi:hypothetical protein